MIKRFGKRIMFWGLLAVISAAGLSACAPAAAITPSPTVLAATVTATEPSMTPQPVASSATTENVPFPQTFQSDLLRSGISPSSYISDQCEYLAARWDPEGSPPWTVVATIMFHGVVPRGETPSSPEHINLDTFDAIIYQAEQLGFETITTQELIGFLQENKAIPARSMLLVLDDRRPGTAEEYFLPVNEAKGWTTTLAWPIGDTDIRTGLWEHIERVNDTGYFDVQSHGLNHDYLTQNTSAEETREEIFGSIPILEEHFGQRPLAYVWPGGNYTELGIELAQEAGFEVGFTVESRGPIMYNWIPQGDKERQYDAPLMLLPRYWSSAAWLNLEQTAQIGDEAQTFALENFADEAAWYAANCGGELSPP